MLSDWFIGIVASQSGPIGYLDPVMSAFRQHAGSGFTSTSRARQWAEFVYGFEAIAPALGERYRSSIDRSICVRSYTTATEFENEGDFKSARRFLIRVLRGQPAWLEPYCAGLGLTGEELFRVLSRRAIIYRFPGLSRCWFWLERLWSTMRWYRLVVELKIRSHLRLVGGDPVGFVRASPNPATASTRHEGLASVTLEWSATTTGPTEVRLGRPSGPPFSRSTSVGKKTTGEWVADGTIFYLQDASPGLPLTRAHTLAAVRVAVRRGDA